jgi:transposase
MSQGKPRDPDKEQYWRQLIQRWQRSRLSARAFCQCHDLSLPSFYAWRRTLRQRDQRTDPAPLVTFVPVQVRHDDDAPPPLELVLANGRCLRIPQGYDADQLRQLLLTLEGLPC